jgi:hypothetical protein
MTMMKTIPSSLLGLLAFSAGLAAQGWARADGEENFVFNPVTNSPNLQAGFRLARVRSSAGSIAVRLSERLPFARDGKTATRCTLRFELLENPNDVNFTHTLLGGQASFRLIETSGDDDAARLLPGSIIHWSLEDSLAGLCGQPHSGTLHHNRTICSWDTDAAKVRTAADAWSGLHLVALDNNFRLSVLWLESAVHALPVRPLGRGSVYLNPVLNSSIRATHSQLR